jgi:hypothetical protein
MQNARVKAQIIRSRCRFTSLESPGAIDLISVRFKFAVSENMDSWFINQHQSGERISDIGASSSTEELHGSPAVKRSA